MRGYRDLIAWQKAMVLATEVYRVTQRFPREETYGLSAQLRRAVVSISSNIAEGCGRNSPKEMHQFAGHARGSLLETETQLELAFRLGFICEKEFDEILARTTELGKILNGLRAWSAKAGS